MIAHLADDAVMACNDNKDDFELEEFEEIDEDFSIENFQSIKIADLHRLTFSIHLSKG